MYGGHSNVGRAVSCAFGMEGAAITIACRDTETGEKVAKEALKYGAMRANVIKCDATSYEETKAAADYALTFGDLDIVYHGIAYDVFGNFFELDRGLWDKIYEVNLKAEMNAWHYILPIMIKQGHGNFVNCGSTMGRMHASMEPVYGALKAGLIHLAQTIAMDVGKYGIRMNIVAPGATSPEDKSKISKSSCFHGFMEDPEKFKDIDAYLASQNPLKQNGAIWDHAWATLYLASDVSGRHLTGQIIGTDGGQYLPK
ncbi:SDR family NAD(P)-dependent oxidoreductase [Clostridium uliginosum]|uniref:SDR family NAD(P)-dependent oxidoreductase n=1 Tax=Clostridium uliginosum TaxID=119641 RepID=UPI001A9A5403|nr:SDR family oxidoreductase [Clostridium uliginosum]